MAGVSKRSVDDLVAALGAESGISKSEVSRICAGLDDTVEAFRSCRLDHIEFPYVFLDATYLNVRNSVAQPASMATVVATGVTAEGNREVLGCDVGDSESKGFWQQFLGSLRDRGLCGGAPGDLRRSPGPRRSRRALVPGRGLPALSGAFHPEPALSLVPRSHQHIAAALFRTIFAQPDVDAAAWDQVTDQLAAGFPKAGPLMDSAKHDVLAFAAFPKAHWPKIWSTNGQRWRDPR